VKVGDLVKFKLLVSHKNWGSEWHWKPFIGHVTGAEYDCDYGAYYEVTDALGEVHLVAACDLEPLESGDA
tara:strand:+ start:233 stop:442 length:210 start_codon:yes stop_codon:yes gene_type:complete